MNETLPAQMDIWEKWAWVWNAIFYAAILISAGLMLRDLTWAARPWIAILLTIGFLAWHLVGMRLAYHGRARWDERTKARFAVIVVDIVLWFVLVNISTAYYVALFGLFGQVFRHLPIRYAITAAGALIVATIAEQMAEPGLIFTLTDPLIWLFSFMVLAAIMLGAWVSAIIAQSSRRRELIEQLAAAQAELADAKRREGVLEERQRLAREIHDTLAQGFTSIVLHLEAAEQALPGDSNTLERHLAQARATARDSLDQARRVVQDLRPDLLARHALPEAIERTAARWRIDSGIDLTTTVTGTVVPLHPHIEVTLLRAAQEALGNVRKHAQATAVQLTLSYMPDAVILDVQDNGVGLNRAPSSPYSGGYGLQAMRERAAACSGEVTIESEPGQGTTIAVTIPLAAQAVERSGTAAWVPPGELPGRNI